MQRDEYAEPTVSFGDYRHPKVAVNRESDDMVSQRDVQKVKH